MGDPGAVQDVGDSPVPDLAIGGVAPGAEGVDHRILEMGPPPTGNELVRVALPARRKRLIAGCASLHRGSRT